MTITVSQGLQVQQKVRSLMKEQAMTTYQLADTCGYTQSDVARSLSPDYANWKLERLYRYAKALGVSPRELLPGKSATAKREK